MDTSLLDTLARAEGVCFSLTVDPDAEPSERWLCQVGLDISEVGPTAIDALDSAMATLVCGDNGPEPDDPRSLGELPIRA